MNKVYKTSIKALLSFAFFLTAFNTFGAGSLRGYVKDLKTNKPVEGVLVVAKLNDIMQGTAYTDDKGFYDIKSLPAGNYNILYKLIEYQDLIVQGIVVSDDQTTEVKTAMLPPIVLGTELGPVIVRAVRAPIEKGKIGNRITGEAAGQMRIINLNKLVGTTAGVYTRNGATPSFLGSRANQTGYFINGVKVIGTIPLIPDALNDVSVITGGVPAQYGDFTGGAINLTFKTPTLAYVNLFDYSNSMMFDRYNFQNLQGYFSGPLKVINKQDPGKERVVLGYTLGFSAFRQRDPNPSAIQLYKIKDDKLAELELRPNSKSPTGDGLVPSASYVTKDDMEKIRYNRNAVSSNVSYISTLSIRPSENVSIQVGLNGSYAQASNYSFTSSLFNYKNQSESVAKTNRFNASMTHKLKSSGDKKEDGKNDKSIVTDALYTVRADYTVVTGNTYDPRHDYNPWNYG